MGDAVDYGALGGDAFSVRVEALMRADYAAVNRTVQPEDFVFLGRAMDDAAKGLPPDESIAKHRAEWRQHIGAQPL